jgi:hypothetical protein
MPVNLMDYNYMNHTAIGYNHIAIGFFLKLLIKVNYTSLVMSGLANQTAFALFLNI